MDDPKQEYFYSGGYVTIFAELSDNDDFVVVKTDDGDLEVVRKNQLVKKEDSYHFKRAEERRIELENITKKAEENLNKIADRVVDRALNSLASRMKFNLVFGKAGTGNSWVMPIVDELENMIKDKASNEIKDFTF